jgi:hypothetical protein
MKQGVTCLVIMNHVLASKGTKQHADDPLSQYASPARDMDVKHGSAPECEDQHLHKCQKKDKGLPKYLAQVRPFGLVVPGVFGKRGNGSITNVARKMRTYQLDHPGHATRHAHRWSHAYDPNRSCHKICVAPRRHGQPA